MKNFNKWVDEFFNKNDKRRVWVALTLAGIADCANAETLKSSISVIETVFQKAVEDAVNAKLAGAGIPKSGTAVTEDGFLNGLKF